MLSVLAVSLGVSPFILLCAEYDYAEFHGAPNLSLGDRLCFSTFNQQIIKNMVTTQNPLRLETNKQRSSSCSIIFCDYFNQ
jgi:hypothetical protein